MNAKLLRRLAAADLAELRSEGERRYRTALKLRATALLHRTTIWRFQAAAGRVFHLAIRNHLSGGVAIPEVKLTEGP